MLGFESAVHVNKISPCSMKLKTPGMDGLSRSKINLFIYPYYIIAISVCMSQFFHDPTLDYQRNQNDLCDNR